MNDRLQALVDSLPAGHPLRARAMDELGQAQPLTAAMIEIAVEAAPNPATHWIDAESLRQGLDPAEVWRIIDTLLPNGSAATRHPGAAGRADEPFSAMACHWCGAALHAGAWEIWPDGRGGAQAGCSGALALVCARRMEHR